METKIASRLLVVMFLVAISLPLAANLAGFDGADPGAENREPAPLPHFDGSLETIPDVIAGLSAWFDDHFGFRSALVRWYGESRLVVLGASPTPVVIKGRDGWFFYGDDGAVEDYARQGPMTRDEVQGWRETLTRSHGWLRERQAAYVFAVAPDKHAIYPEKMPAALRRVGDMSRTDQVYEALAGTGVAAVDLRPALVAGRTHERVYQRTDTHWNDLGAFAAYRQIIAAVRAQAPTVPPAWTRDDFELVERNVEGMDLAAMMGLKRWLRESDLTLVSRRRRQAIVVEPRGAAATDEEGLLITEIRGSMLPRAVIFRDSFASRLVPFLSEHFSRASYFWQNDFAADVIRREQADVVIQEIAGRHLYNYVPSPELIPHAGK